MSTDPVSDSFEKVGNAAAGGLVGGLVGLIFGLPGLVLGAAGGALLGVKYKPVTIGRNLLASRQS